MRIATAHAYDTSIQNLQKRQQDLSESQMQLTSGKRVNVASDDPTAAARAERALASIARGEANKRSLDASRNVMNLASSSLTTGAPSMAYPCITDSQRSVSITMGALLPTAKVAKRIESANEKAAVR
mgnify:CR=1 FL=1